MYPSLNHLLPDTQSVMLEKYISKLKLYSSRFWLIALSVIPIYFFIGVLSDFSRFTSYSLVRDNTFFDLTAFHDYFIQGAYIPYILYSLTILLLATFIQVVVFLIPSRIASSQLSTVRERIHIQAVQTSEGQAAYLSSEIQRLTEKAAVVFYENAYGRDKAQEWIKAARKTLSGKDADKLNRTQSLISSIDELILREEKQQLDQGSWRTLAIVIIFIYITGILAAILLVDGNLSNKEIPIMGVPPSIILWGAIGSLAAILYRFYTEQSRIRLAAEIRWLIARPIIGIIMGSLAYLVFSTGLILFNSNPTSTNSDGGEVLGVYWVLAFVAGFSDKFYLSIIDLLIEKSPLKPRNSEGQDGASQPTEPKGSEPPKDASQKNAENKDSENK